MKLLLIGPLPPPTGGATVLFKQLIDELSDNSDIKLTIIDTSGKAKIAKVNLFFRVLIRFLKEVKNADVISFHASLRGSLLFSPFIFMVCKLYSKPWLFRGFGGNYPSWYQGLSGLSQWLFNNTLLSANIILLETKESVSYFQSRAKHLVKWYPNSRRNSNIINDSTQAKRFVYISQIKPSKGIYVLIDAMNGIEGVKVDCYGPLSEGVKESDFDGRNISYNGVLSPENVSSVLAEYDALVFPTFYEGEGYPGVILEAYAAALPVITTKWRCIPEIVDEECGILVEPKSVTQLREAIILISNDHSFFLKLKAGALKKADFFGASQWADKFVNLCASLITDKV